MKATIIILLLLANVAHLECKMKKKKGAGKDLCFPMSEKEEVYRFGCRNGKVISNITVRSFVASKCEDSGGCEGLQVEVLKTSNLCYWKQSCELPFSSVSPLIRTSNRSCIGRKPSSLFLRYMCTKSKSITFFQSNLTKTFDNQNLSWDSGILVSHIDYPWHYLDGLKFGVTLRPLDSRFTHLYLWKQFFDVDAEDRLGVRTEDGDLQEFSNVLTGRSVNLEFVTEEDSHRGPGFIICYKWDEANKKPTQNFVCSEKKRRRKGRGKRNKNKKNRRKDKKRTSRRRNRKKRVILSRD